MTENIGKLLSLVVNTAVLFLVLAVGFGIGEIVTRILYKDTTVMFPRYHTDAQYGEFTVRRIRPNSDFVHTSVDGTWEFSTNKQGFRNYQDFEYANPEGSIRIISLGDSHTQGYECDQDYTYSSVIEKRLKALGIDAQVLNTGVSGFSTAEALVLLEQELIKYQPDFIVLGFFANDFVDNLKAGIYRLSDTGELVVVKKEHIPGVKVQDFIYAIPGVHWLSENSYFYSLLFNNVWAFFKRQLTVASKKGVTDEAAVATKKNFANYEVDLAAALIKRIYDVSHEAGAKLIILDIPQVESLNRSWPSVVKELLPAVLKNSDYFVSNQVLREYQGSARLHVPHGNRHISEFTHTVLGVEAARYIQAAREKD